MTHRGDPANPLYLIYKQISAHGGFARKPQPSPNQASPIPAAKSPRPQDHSTASLWQIDGVVMAIRRRRYGESTASLWQFDRVKLPWGRGCLIYPKSGSWGSRFLATKTTKVTKFITKVTKFIMMCAYCGLYRTVFYFQFSPIG